ncbi:MAG TPA: (d)CMP kinase [Steroidobacteraceae bacterium]|nr:(d)CMP kinase [Steroidobacteraceae bacterium]
MNGTPVIAIDGPSGSGKGTVSRRVASQLGWHLLDSGALYRLVALAGQRAGLTAGDEGGHAALAARMAVTFGQRPDGDELVLLGASQEDVTGAIRTEVAGQGASRVAIWPGVRAALLQRQRDFAQPPGLVADGRDMGTVVFPTAALKIYLTASPEERARRRHKQLKDKGSGASLAALSQEIAERDQRDSTRAVAPLVPAADAIAVDSTSLSIEAVVERIMAEARARGL